MNLFFIFAFCGGPLLPTWMFLNSLHLIFHLVLINSDIPAIVHYFMTKYLSTLRLHFMKTEEFQDSIIGCFDEDDYKVLSDEKKNGFSTSHFKECGYSYNLLPNLFIVMTIAILIAFVWLLIMVVNLVQRQYKKQRSKLFCTNFNLRFLYEFSLEIFVSTTICLAYSGRNSGEVAFIISILVVIILACSLIFCVSLCFKNGPYIKGSFTRGTVIRSFWSVRPINPDCKQVNTFSEGHQLAERTVN